VKHPGTEKQEGALYAEAVTCTLSVGPKIKTEIPAQLIVVTCMNRITGEEGLPGPPGESRMKIARYFTICLLAFVLPSAWSQQSTKPVYQNEKAPIPERVRDLLGRMTLEEKVAQLQSGMNLPGMGMQAPTLFNKDQLNEALVKQTLGNGLGTYVFLDEFVGMSKGPREGAINRNLLQTWVMKNTRLGIPILFHGEALHGSAVKGATSFPQAIGLGSTWDPDLLKEMWLLSQKCNQHSFGRGSRAQQ
jgi:hypothetical protein